MNDTLKKARLVGSFIRQSREAVGLSQRALGLLFTPPVTTQFISNVERGVTPLPPLHIPTLIKALKMNEIELMSLLEREYQLKLSDRVGVFAGNAETNGSPNPPLIIHSPDLDFIKKIYQAYRQSDDQTKQAFAKACENILKL